MEVWTIDQPIPRNDTCGPLINYVLGEQRRPCHAMKIWGRRCNGSQVARDFLGRLKYGEIIADNLSKAGWSWGRVSAVDSDERTIFIADAHCGDGKRFVARANQKLIPAATRQESAEFDGGSRKLSWTLIRKSAGHGY